MAVKWHWIGNGLDEWLSIGKRVISVVFYCPSGITVAVKWHCIGNGLVEWLSIGKKVISVIFHCLSGITVEVKWLCIGNGLVEWFSIGRKVISVVITVGVALQWRSSGTQLAMDWLSGYPLVVM